MAHDTETPPAKKRKLQSDHEFATESPIVPHVHQQEGSRLIQLPQEIRDEIYSIQFMSTRLASLSGIDIPRERGIPDGKEFLSTYTTAKGTGLSLLRCCRRMHQEIGTSWLSQVLFHFEGAEAVLNKLGGVPIETYSQIRYLSFSPNEPLKLWVLDKDDDPSEPHDPRAYEILHVLKLFPGLSLDVLIVVPAEHLSYPVRNYRCFDELVRYGRDSSMLGYAVDADDETARSPQPSGWQRALEERDGITSKPSVQILRDTLQNDASSGADQPYYQLQPFSQSFADGQDAASFSETQDHSLVYPGEHEKRILVTITRGAGIEYTEEECSPLLPEDIEDIRRDFPTCGLSWTKIKERSKSVRKQMREAHRARCDGQQHDCYEGCI